MTPINVKGTHDILFADGPYYAYVRDIFSQVASLYGYSYLEPPVLEYTEVFLRSTGESSDIVRKEMYTFNDKGDRSVTMRPEFTAGVLRAMASSKLYADHDLPLKAFYFGPAFRYERPHLGRYRQFYQAGIEAVGADSPFLDAEAVVLACSALSLMGFKGLKVKVNTLGGATSRAAYKEALKAYFAERIDEMCEDCHTRLELNPLRILDCKVPHDHELALGAPKMKDYLTKEDEDRFYNILSLLATMEIDYEIDDTLVRGLDYYGGLVFEVHGSTKKGEDIGALLGGGHYDGLLSAFGGPSDIDHGVGFAMGVERLITLLKEQGLELPESDLDLYLMPLGEKAYEACYFLLQQLRMSGFKADMPIKTGKLGSYFKKAEKRGAKIALIAGDSEIDGGTIQVKNLATQEQREIPMEELAQTLDQLLVEDDGHDCGCHHHHHEDGECCCGHHHEDGECDCQDDKDGQGHECCCRHHHHE